LRKQNFLALQIFSKINGTKFVGAVYKISPQSEGRGFVQCGHFSKKGGGGLQMRTSTLIGKKYFFEIYGVSARTRGVEPVRTGGSIFRDFVRSTF